MLVPINEGAGSGGLGRADDVRRKTMGAKPPPTRVRRKATGDASAPQGVKPQSVSKSSVGARARSAAAGGPQDRVSEARYGLGAVVKHRVYPFRGIVFDIDPVFNSTEEWWQSIPEEIRPRKDQPFYHLLAENAETEYVAYVSEQNLLPDTSGEPLRHPKVAELFVEDEDGTFHATFLQAH